MTIQEECHAMVEAETNLYREVYGEVADIAKRTVRDVMVANYEAKMAKGDWRERDAEYHLKHGKDHANSAYNCELWQQAGNPCLKDALLEEIDHAICRLAMAKVRLLESLAVTDGKEAAG